MVVQARDAGGRRVDDAGVGAGAYEAIKCTSPESCLSGILIATEFVRSWWEWRATMIGYDGKRTIVCGNIP